MRRSYDRSDLTQEDLLTELRRLAKNNGGQVSQSDMENDGKYSITTYQDIFGQWSDAKRAAGIKTFANHTARMDVSYRDPDELRRLYHDKHLSTAQIAERFDCDRKTIDNWMHRFGININPGKLIRRKQMGENNSAYNQVNFTCDYCGEEKTTPASDAERTNHNFCGRDCYRSWRRENQSKLPNPPDNTVPTDDLITDLQLLADDLGRPPSSQDILDHGKNSPATHIRRFGSIPDAREAAGLEKHILFGKRGIRLKTGDRHPYGESWRENRERRIQRDDESCVICGMTRQEHERKHGVDLHVHHIVPAIEFDDLEQADRLDNLITLCASHHRKWEHIPLRPQND